VARDRTSETSTEKVAEWKKHGQGGSVMKVQKVFWIGLFFLVSLMIAACSGTTPIPQAEEPISAASVVTEELTVESVVTEKPNLDRVAIKEPTAESVITEEPTAESVITEEPTAESVITEEPTVESVITEEPENSGPRTGDIAPDFTLPNSNGNMVHLADELNDYRIVVLVFYNAYY
jgi:uncharacterized protein YcfL